jgi:hypothetical protein
MAQSQECAFEVPGEPNASLERRFSCRVQVVRLIGQIVDQAFPAVAVEQRANAAAAAAY